MNMEKIIKIVLGLSLALILLDSVINLSDNRYRIFGKVSSYVGNSDTELNQEWADKVMQGGYLHLAC